MENKDNNIELVELEDLDGLDIMDEEDIEKKVKEIKKKEKERNVNEILKELKKREETFQKWFNNIEEVKKVVELRKELYRKKFKNNNTFKNNYRIEFISKESELKNLSIKTELVSPFDNNDFYSPNDKFIPFVDMSDNLGLITTNPIIKLKNIDTFGGYLFNIKVVSMELFEKIIEENYDVKIFENKDASVNLTLILQKALEKDASDIYLRQFPLEGTITFRIDEVNFTQSDKLSHEDMSRLFDVIKNHSGQGNKEGGEIKGKFSWEVGGQLREFRLAMENQSNGFPIAVLRALAKHNDDLTLKDLGYLNEDLELIRRIFSLPMGLVLVTGITGSGKTTTMMVALNEYQKSGNKMVYTVEDPVEITNPNLIQYQVNTEGEKAYHKTFDSYVKLLLRQKPDAALIGESRSKDEIMNCTKLANTGHLTFTTLHSSSVLGTFKRLAQEGVHKKDLLDSLSAIISQRLVPKLCSCKIKDKEAEQEMIDNLEMILKMKGLSDEEYEKQRKFYIKEITEKGLYKHNPKGCDICKAATAGYKGKVPVYEIAFFDKGGVDRFDIIDGKPNYVFVSKLEVSMKNMLMGNISINEFNIVKQEVLTSG